MLHDTAAIRRAARTLETIASKIKAEADKDAKSIRSDLNALNGSTANAIDDVMDELVSKLKKTSSGIISCATVLRDYADKLDEADEKAQALISSN